MPNHNKVLEFPNRELLHEQAAGWIARMEAGDLGREEEKELIAWAAQSAHHKKILLDTATVWDRMDVMSGLSELLSLEDIQEKRTSTYMPAIPLAGALLICLSVLVYYYFPDLAEPRQQATPTAQVQVPPRIYHTPVGGNQEVTLADGSVVKLNTATRLAVDFSATRRNISLFEGEAFFKVAKNETVPFIVAVDGTYIKAVGTAFSIQKLSAQAEVTVTEGLVQVIHKEKHDDKDGSTPNTAYIRAGQVAQISDDGEEEIQDVPSEEIARKLLWQQKMLAFEGHTLQYVINEFSRYTTFNIHIADTSTAAIRVGGYFRSDDIAGLLTSLEDNFAISVQQTATNSFELRKAERN